MEGDIFVLSNSFAFSQEVFFTEVSGEKYASVDGTLGRYHHSLLLLNEA